MSYRLDYLKHSRDKQKGSAVIIMRRSDGEWLIDEVERLEEENERLNRIISSAADKANTILMDVRK